MQIIYVLLLGLTFVQRRHHMWFAQETKMIKDPFFPHLNCITWVFTSIQCNSGNRIAFCYLFWCVVKDNIDTHSRSHGHHAIAMRSKKHTWFAAFPTSHKGEPVTVVPCNINSTELLGANKSVFWTKFKHYTFLVKATVPWYIHP